MALQTPVFNFHDIALILVVFQSLLLAALLLTVRQGKVLSSRLLAFLIAAIGFEALDTLMYWCVPLKQLHLQSSPLIFFLFEFAVLLQGPLLLFYVKSVIYTDYALRRRDLLHLLPALFTPIYVGLIAVSLGPEKLRAGVHDYAIYWRDPVFRGLILAQAVIVPIYSFAALRLILGYRQRLKENYSNLDRIERTWLKILIISFCLICLWNLTARVVSLFNVGDLPALLGLISNYLDFLFANFLVFYNLLYSNIVQGVRDPEGERQTDASVPDSAPVEQGGIKRDEFLPHQISAVEQTIHQDKIYLLHDLTLEQLAAAAHLSPRITSSIINRHFGMSFFDFINYHRVETAKTMLAIEPDKSVLEIAEMAGFNSKSAFNRFFKKFSGATPTEFRKEATNRTQNSAA